MVDNLPGSAKKPGHYFPVTFFRANSMQRAVPQGGIVGFVDGDGEVKHVGNSGAQEVV